MSKPSYNLARGNMLAVWGKAVCPICGDELTHVCDDFEDWDGEEWELNTYACADDALLFTYVSPRGQQYHEVSDGDKFYIVEGA